MSFKIRHIGLFFILMLVIVISCKKEKNNTTSDIGYNYFKDEVGSYIIYDVDSIVYDDFEKDTDYYKYQIKEVVESQFTDNQNRPTLRIERYQRNYVDTIPYNQLSWKIKDVWYANKTNKNVERVEENERFVKLVFPVQKGVKWNGNIFNTKGEWNYEYEKIDAPASFGTLSFDSTLLVKQFDDENKILIQRQYYAEVYAKNVGLVQRKIIDVKSTNTNYSLNIMNRITSGVVYTQTINAYGKQ